MPMVLYETQTRINFHTAILCVCGGKWPMYMCICIHTHIHRINHDLPRPFPKTKIYPISLKSQKLSQKFHTVVLTCKGESTSN